jgi:hypothetical protein
MMWAFINETGSIELYNKLPVNWQNVSNFFALESDVTTLQAFNWYPVSDQVPDYDPYAAECGEITCFLDTENNVVIRTATVTSKSQEQLNHEHNLRGAAFLLDLRSRRDFLLSSSDWTQAADVQASKTDEWKQQWAEYRQWLRDLPEIYSQPSFESVTDSNQVEWRRPPS